MRNDFLLVFFFLSHSLGWSHTEVAEDDLPPSVLPASTPHPYPARVRTESVQLLHLVYTVLGILQIQSILHKHPTKRYISGSFWLFSFWDRISLCIPCFPSTGIKDGTVPPYMAPNFFFLNKYFFFSQGDIWGVGRVSGTLCGRNPEAELYLGELFKAQGANQTGRFSMREREPQTSTRNVHSFFQELVSGSAR